MRTVSIPDEIFVRLARQAALLNMTVEQLIVPLLEHAAENAEGGQVTAMPGEASYEDWKKKFDAWLADVHARAHRYPAGFLMDDSRERIYQGCGE
jgi:hypothetical protein